MQQLLIITAWLLYDIKVFRRHILALRKSAML